MFTCWKCRYSLPSSLGNNDIVKSSIYKHVSYLLCHFRYHCILNENTVCKNLRIIHLELLSINYDNSLWQARLASPRLGQQWKVMDRARIDFISYQGLRKTNLKWMSNVKNRHTAFTGPQHCVSFSQIYVLDSINRTVDPFISLCSGVYNMPDGKRINLWSRFVTFYDRIRVWWETELTSGFSSKLVILGCEPNITSEGGLIIRSEV